MFFAYNLATKTKLTFHQELFPLIDLKLFVFEARVMNHDSSDTSDIPSFDLNLPLLL